MNAIEILQGLLTPVIAVLGCYIAYQQHKINKDRFRHELYDKRLNVFKATIVLISQILLKGKVDIYDINQFRANTVEAAFLFKKDVQEYLDNLNTKACKLFGLLKTIESIRDCEERKKLLSEVIELQKWFTEQFDTVITMFTPYLKPKGQY